MCLKSVNHDRKILDLEQSDVDWFRNDILYSGLASLCDVLYMTINHGMRATFAERCHSETPFFHLPISEMTITLDDVSCLLHILIRGKLSDHRRLGREEASEMLVTYLEANPTETINELTDIGGAHSRFKFLDELYKDHL